MQFKKCEAIESIAVKLTKERLLWFLKKPEQPLFRKPLNLKKRFQA